MVQKHEFMARGFNHYYNEWDRHPKHWSGGRIFHEDQIDEAIDYARERIEAVGLEPEELKKEYWTVGDQVFHSFEKANIHYKKINHVHI